MASDGMVLHWMASDGVNGMGWHGMAWYCIGWDRMTLYCLGWHGMAWMAWNGMVLHWMASDGMGWHRMPHDPKNLLFTAYCTNYEAATLARLRLARSAANTYSYLMWYNNRLK